MRVLPRWFLATRPVTMVTLKRDGVPAKVRIAMIALERHFACDAAERLTSLKGDDRGSGDKCYVRNNWPTASGRAGLTLRGSSSIAISP